MADLSDPASAPQLDRRRQYAYLAPEPDRRQQYAQLAPERVPSEPPYPVETSQQVSAGEKELVPREEKELIPRGRPRFVGSNRGARFRALIALCAAVILAVAIGTALGVTLNRKNSSSSPSTSSESRLSVAVSTSSTSSSTTPASVSAGTSPSIYTTHSISSTSSSPTSPSATASVMATIDCPQSNRTEFTPSMPGSDTNGSSSAPGIFTFTKYYGLGADGDDIVTGYATSFNGCIELCSDYNYAQGGIFCAAAVYVTGNPPQNCWAKNSTSTYEYQESGYAGEAGMALIKLG